MSKALKLIVTGAMLAALFVLPGAAVAKPADRDHDSLPDKWEKSHQISTTAKSAAKDPDGDKLNNKRELRFGMDPRDKDSDNDGVIDSKENAGVVKSFENNVLTIDLANGTSLSGTVNDRTRIVIRSTDDAEDYDHACERDAQEGDAQGTPPRLSRTRVRVAPRVVRRATRDRATTRAPATRTPSSRTCRPTARAPVPAVVRARPARLPT